MLAKNEVNKYIRDEVYASKSSIEFVHLTVITIANDQTPSTHSSALCPALTTQ